MLFHPQRPHGIDTGRPANYSVYNSTTYLSANNARCSTIPRVFATEQL